MDFYTSMNIDNMNTIINDTFSAYKIAKDNINIHNILVEAALVSRDIAERIVDIAINVRDSAQGDIEYNASVITLADFRADFFICNRTYLDMRSININMKYNIGNILNDLRLHFDENLKNVKLMINEKNNLLNNIFNIIEMSEILLPIVKEKHVVHKILLIKQEMELVNLKRELEYIGTKLRNYMLVINVD